jgi:hypothetical protein
MQGGLYRCASDARRIGGNDEQRELMATLRIDHLAATHHHDGISLIHARGPVLGAVEQPTIAILLGCGGDLVGVGACIGFGDGKRHALFARRQTRQPFVF